MPERALVSRLSNADLPEVSRIHMKAFPESLLTALGRGSVERYYSWLLTGPHQVTALKAEAEGKTAGFCFGGVFRGALSGFVRKNAAYLFFSVLVRPAVYFNPETHSRLSQGLKILTGRREKMSPAREPETKSFGILSVAVDPAFQGFGAGGALMAESEKIARELGFRSMDLTVRPENVKAVSFYKNSGWRPVEAGTVWKGRMLKTL